MALVSGAPFGRSKFLSSYAGMQQMLRIPQISSLVKLGAGRTKKRPRSARRYLATDAGVEKFFSTLNDMNVRYVCLRWHEDLPHVRAGEDIDLLIGDNDLERVEMLLMGNKKNGTPVDVYTVSGLPGCGYCSAPYFLPSLARFALENPRIHKGIFKIPSAKSHFYTMCYHVVYHKGPSSGLSEKYPQDVARPADHDYASTITQMAKTAGVPVPRMTLRDIDELLDEEGWKPADDTLRKYGSKNHWLLRQVAGVSPPQDPDLDGLAVFLVRDRARVLLNEIIRHLDLEGFEILGQVTLSPSDADRIEGQIRGGNWSRGPWALSGGRAATAISAFDCFPRMELTPENSLELCNIHIQRAKERILLRVIKPLPKEERFDPLHPSGSPHEALEYLRLIDKKFYDHSCDAARLSARKSRQPFPAKARLDGLCRRAKVEVIQYKGKAAICKTFRPNALRFLERELLARTLAPDSDLIPAILEAGADYFVTDLFEHDKRQLSSLRPLFSKNKFIPVWAIVKCRELIRHFRSKGYELIDFTPKNLLFDKTAGLKCIDFEFLQKSGAPTKDLVGSYAWWLPPPEFAGDYPNTSRMRDPYSLHWFERTGIPRGLCSTITNSFLLSLIQLFGFSFLSVRNIARAVFARIKRVTGS